MARKLPEAEYLLQLREQGWKLGEIAEEYGVNVSSVWVALNRAGFVPEKVTYKSIVPWDVESHHASTSVMRHLRTLARKKAGIAVNARDDRRLSSWLRDLQHNNLVLDYHPDAPPNDASEAGGFYYRTREPEDTWIIREPR